MIRLVLFAAVLMAMFGMVAMSGEGQPDKKDGQQQAHNVFFSLKDNSPAEVQKVVDACKKYLTKHDGEVSFSVGTLAKDRKREVNDQDFDVSLQIIFANPEAHDRYQASEGHKQFVAEVSPKCKKVRIFDSYLSK